VVHFLPTVGFNAKKPNFGELVTNLRKGVAAI
jgi:hypothetical protein